MRILDFFRNTFLYRNKYKTHSEAVIIACYFNPQRNPYRLIAFREFYNSIKHLNHHIVECVIDGSKPELVDEFPSLNITRVFTKNLLWHKESLLNGIIEKLPTEFKYVFWVDTDVIFTNKRWLVDGVKDLQTNNLVQPFEYCVHLEQDQREPNFDMTHEYEFATDVSRKHPNVWKSFGSRHYQGGSANHIYDVHGHVGFAWGARRDVFNRILLYDKALIGGADHIIAHAGAGHINHTCITKSFTDDIAAVNKWSEEFYRVVKGKIGFVKGDLYHIWHGDIKKRQYLRRVQEFTPQTKQIVEKDKNGLYVTHDDSYVKKYFDEREVKGGLNKGETSLVMSPPHRGKSFRNESINISASEYKRKREELEQQYPYKDSSFIDSLILGYITDSTVMGTAMGGDVMGAMIGDMLNTSDETNNQFDTSNDVIDTPSDSTYEVNNDNFS